MWVVIQSSFTYRKQVERLILLEIKIRKGEIKMSEENRFSDDGKIHDKQRLKELQALPLERKMQITQTRLIEWYTAWDGKCYVSFSGGKDSTVLADQAAKVCKMLGYKLILWFSDTGLEYPEIKLTVQNMGKYLEDKYGIEVETVIDYPKDKDGKRITFRRVIEEYGYPLISKEVADNVYRARRGSKNAIDRMNGLNPDGSISSFKKTNIKYKYLLNAPFEISNKCCNEMKKKPSKAFEKRTGYKAIVGTMAVESAYRKTGWLLTGCNAFDTPRPMSQPMAFWTEQDVFQYIVENNIPISPIYGEIIKNNNGKWVTTGCERTGCMYCGFGIQCDKSPTRFEKLKETHPKIYEYCMKPWDEGGLGLDEVLNYINVKH